MLPLWCGTLESVREKLVITASTLLPFSSNLAALRMATLSDHFHSRTPHMETFGVFCFFKLHLCRIILFRLAGLRLISVIPRRASVKKVRHREIKEPFRLLSAERSGWENSEKATKVHRCTFIKNVSIKKRH